MNTNLRDLLCNKLHLAPNACIGKVIIVTGAGQGIGLQTARAFALLGAKVIIAELSEQGQAAADAILAEGGQARFVQTDVSCSASIHELVETTRQFFGPADVVINNAIRIASVPVLEMDEAVWDQILAVNLRGTFLTCKAFLPDMIARGSGVLINMVSVDAMPGLSAYIASKQGIVGLSQSLALEVEPSGIQVIPFAPGMVDTPGIRSVAADLAPRLGITQEQFLKLSLHAAYDGLMPPEHAGAATAYLALHLAKEFHGQVVNGYEVLERAGFLSTSPVEMPATKINEAADGVTVKTGPGPDESIPCILEVQEILLQTAAEFEKLPAFIRPLARNGFKGKAGASLNDWQRSLSALKDRLESGSLPKDEASAFSDRLKNLITYFEGVPAETARFTRDKAMLVEVSRLTATRMDAIHRLMNALTPHPPIR